MGWAETHAVLLSQTVGARSALVARHRLGPAHRDERHQRVPRASVGGGAEVIDYRLAARVGGGGAGTEHPSCPDLDHSAIAA